MKINYSQILNKNMINVLKDVLYEIKKNDKKTDHHLYITFRTNNKNVIRKIIKPSNEELQLHKKYLTSSLPKNFYK